MGRDAREDVDPLIQHYNPLLWKRRQRKTAASTSIDALFDYKDYKVGEGTYGLVYKGHMLANDSRTFAIKKIKSVSSHHDVLTISACREIMLLRELSHANIVQATHVFLGTGPLEVSLVFEYAEHDVYQIVEFHRGMKKSKTQKWEIPESMVKSIVWQTLNGLHYLHTNWVLHRDMKPANVLVMGEGRDKGRVKIADLGMARLFQNPLRCLTDVDPVVVTIWYRAPEILLGARHYTKAIDVWALGCILTELITTTPLFHVEQRDDPTFKTPFQKHQLLRIFNIMGWPNWSGLRYMPEFNKIQSDDDFKSTRKNSSQSQSTLWNHLNSLSLGFKHSSQFNTTFELIKRMLDFDPLSRITTSDAMRHNYFTNEHTFSPTNCFWSVSTTYPLRTSETRTDADAKRKEQRESGSNAKWKNYNGPPPKKPKYN